LSVLKLEFINSGNFRI